MQDLCNVFFTYLHRWLNDLKLVQASGMKCRHLSRSYAGFRRSPSNSCRATFFIKLLFSNAIVQKKLKMLSSGVHYDRRISRIIVRHHLRPVSIVSAGLVTPLRGQSNDCMHLHYIIFLTCYSRLRLKHFSRKFNLTFII